MTNPLSSIDFKAIKARQQGAWASGNYAVVGTTLQIVGESLCEALDLAAGSRVLDVAAGNGNAALAAARRWCEVTATDYVPSLLDQARKRADAEGAVITFGEADAEALPFADGSYDVAFSTFGVMFTPDQEKAASELLRVVKSGGKIGLANWTPDGFIGQLFKVVGKHIAPPPGVKPASLWGTEARIKDLFGAGARSISCRPKQFVFRYRSPAHWLDVFRGYYGPVLKAFAALDPAGQKALETDIVDLIARFNTAKDGAVAAASDYLEIVIVKA